MITVDNINEAFVTMEAEIGEAAHIVLMNPVVYAAIDAQRAYRGRDWRRVKREVRKAMRNARLLQRVAA